MFMEEHLDLPLRDVLTVMQDRILQKTTYFGVVTMKNPLDSWVYQEVITAQRPDVIIEIGNASGGSTLALAHLLDHLGHGRVLALDVNHAHVPPHVKEHDRITWFEGPAVDSYELVRANIQDGDDVLVIEDSSHTYEHTLAVLRTYSDFVQPGGWFIVEDSICHHGLDVGPDPGPYEAIETFISQSDKWEIDRSMESWLITWNPKGFLRRLS